MQRDEQWNPVAPGDEISGTVKEIEARDGVPTIVLSTEDGARILSLYNRKPLAEEIGKIKRGMTLTVQYDGYSSVLSKHEWAVQKEI